ncbi:hypothetical protein HU200_017539 [Digitaria exilis]|uniref:RING-type E3 ubiquitin transferase n=1 Tax=Digitaria exilis TaxID=1010633 RepID=A0A835F679_9POAL|nr:hypothetical protein HU200_017539 [Digitaria exilis]
MERQTARRTQTDVTQMIESLFASVNLAKDLSARCKGRSLQLTDDDIQNIAQDLENVLQNIYDDLSRIPTSSFGSNAYMDVLIQSQSMRGYSEADISMNVMGNRRKSLRNNDTPKLVDFLQGMYRESDEYGGQMFNTLSEVAEYIEPMYDAFFCPLTNEIMTDPVITESGVTCDRRAIEEYIERFSDSSEPVYCPFTKMPMQTRLLDNHNAQIQCDALELLCLLAEDEEGKDIIGKTKAIARTVKLLSSNTTDERHAAISFLLELSKSQLLLESIGSTPGSILILTTMKINYSDDPIAAEKAGAVLKNLEKCPKNIKYMAESGYLEPLRNHLVEGSEEMQMEMVSFLSELVQEQELTIDINRSTSEILIKMARSCKPMVRKAAFDVLVQLSFHRPNSMMLVDAGAVPVMIEELFIRKVDDEPVNSMASAGTILANIVESGIDPETTLVNKEGHVLTSKYSIYNFVHMLKCFMPDDLNLSIIRVLLAFTALAKPLATVVSVIRENHRGHAIVELMSSQMEALSLAATRLLITLSPHIGHTIVERLCKTQGQPRKLVKSISHAGRITERQAALAMLLARLPYRNTSLNVALVQEGAVPAILSAIKEMQNNPARSSRHAVPYMEGLVGALVRLTATLYSPEVLKVAMDHNLASVLTELLTGAAGSDEAQRLAAVGLENLSYLSIKLSQPPPDELLSKKNNTILKLLKDSKAHSNKKSSHIQVNVCLVHRGVCSPATTFCLLEAGSVEGLLGCLENDNVRVVEAALGALCTLLDERVDVEKSVAALSELDAARRVLGALRQHRQNVLWQKCFCVVEKLLEHGDDRCVREVTGDRMLPTALVSAFHRGDASTKQAAESILRRLHKMPDYSATYVSMEF